MKLFEVGFHYNNVNEFRQIKFHGGNTTERITLFYASHIFYETPWDN